MINMHNTAPRVKLFTNRGQIVRAIQVRYSPQFLSAAAFIIPSGQHC